MDGLNGQRILVLEEEVSIAQLLAEMLEALNCQVIGPAERIPQALALLVDHHVDAAILDVKVRGQSTAPVAEDLLRRGIPWAFASGNRTRALPKRYPGALWITKPYSSAGIRDVVRRLTPNDRGDDQI